MSNWVKAVLTAWVFCLAAAASAQDALDQTDPSQEADREDPFAPESSDIYIEYEPVLLDPEPAADTDALDVGAIVIDGLIALERSDFADVVSGYMGRTLTVEELSQLTQQIAGLARERGYLFANAWIPPQPLVAGMLRIQVDEGVIDDIRIIGSQDPAIRKMLEPLRNGQPVSVAALERQLLLADDLPGVYFRDTRFEREGGQGILVVQAYRQDWWGRATLSNDGTKPIGPVRARIDIDANGLLLDRDGVDLSFTVTPAEIDELVFFSMRYNVVVNDAGTDLSLFSSYSRNEPGAYLANSEINGKSWRAGLRVRHPLIRRRSHGLWLEGSVEMQDLRQDRFGALARHDRITLARIGAYAFFNGPGGLLRSRLTVSQGLDMLGATQTGDPLASRFDAAPDFTTLDWWVSYRRPLGGRFSISLDGLAQLSTAPLLIGEDIGLGGNYYLRGYDFSSRTGDQGVMGVGELRYDWPRALGPIERMQIYAFADGGVVSNLEDGFGGGSLASGGAGLRTDLPSNFDFDLEVAVPLTGPRYDTEDKTPRVNLRLSKSF